MGDTSHLTPCGSCPWRRGATPEAIPSYDRGKACDLSSTVGDSDDFRPIMACHLSEDGAERPCAGYIAAEGYSNLAVRLATIAGRIDLIGTEEACAGLDLYDSFAAMQGNLLDHP